MTMQRRLGAYAIACLAACAFCLMLSIVPTWAYAADLHVTSTDATAGTVRDGVYHLSPVADRDLAVSVAGESTKAGARAQLADRSEADWSQKWIVVQDGATGTCTIRNLHSRMLLGVKGAVRAGAKVKQVKPSAAKNRKWIAIEEQGGIVFKSVANPNVVLAVAGSVEDGARLRLDGASGSAVQRFALTAVAPIEDGRACFVRNVGTGRALAVAKDVRKKGAKLSYAKASSKKAQKFRFVKKGSSYLMQGVASCRYVVVKKGGLRLATGKKKSATKWKLELDLQTGTFRLAKSGKRLDSVAGKPSLAGAADTASQQFVIVPTYGFKVYLDPGHGKQSDGSWDPGAEGGGREEAKLTRDLVDRIADELAQTDVEVVNGAKYALSYHRRNAKANSLKCDVALSVHFDAGGGSSTSTMVGTRGPLAKSKAFNKIIHKALASSVGLSDGGTSHRSDITFVNGKVPAVLMEVAFIDNSSSIGKYLGRRDDVATSIAEGIVKASRVAKLQR